MIDVDLKHIGSFGGLPAKLIDLTVSDGSQLITTTVTGLNGEVDKQLIDRLEVLVEELKEQNERLNRKK